MTADLAAPLVVERVGRDDLSLRATSPVGIATASPMATQSDVVKAPFLTAGVEAQATPDVQISELNIILIIDLFLDGT